MSLTDRTIVAPEVVSRTATPKASKRKASNVEARLRREKQFHDQRFGGDDSERGAAKKYYTANQAAEKKYEDLVVSLCENKRLLEYGCGAGSESVRWLQNGAVLSGVDISEEGILKARQLAQDSGYEASYYVMNAENMTFEDECFDVVVGTGILHHLELKDCYRELSRVLDENGHAIFIEPLGHNPLINLYRALTPAMRTDDEHPLLVKDLDQMREYFSNVDIHYFSLFSLCAVPFRRFPFHTSLLKILEKVDSVLFKIPGIGRFAWIVVIDARK